MESSGDQLGRSESRTAPEASQKALPGLERRLAHAVDDDVTFHTLVRNAPLGIAVYRLEADGRLVLTLANPAADQILGFSLGENVGSTLEDLFPSIAGTTVPTVFRTLARDGGSWRTEQLDYTDSLISGAYQVQAFQIGSMRVAVLFEDVSSRAMAVRAMRDSADKARASDQRTIDMVFRTDSAGKLLFVSDTSVDLFGIRPDEMIGRGFVEFLSPASIDEAVGSFRAAIGGRHTGAALVLRMLKRDGAEFFGELRSSVTMEAGRPTGTLGVIRDVSQRMEAQDEIRRIEARLLDTQRLESLGVLAGGIAHDIRHALESARVHAERALAESGLGQSARAEIEATVTAVERAAALCEQLSAFSGRHHSSVVDFDVRDVLPSLSQIPIPSLGHGVALAYQLPASLPLVRGDVQQLRRAVLSLISGAAESAGSGGCTVTISAGTAECSREDLAETATGRDLPEGIYVFLEVADDGPALDADARSRLFDPSALVGLAGRRPGLAAVLGVARNFHGTIRVDSAPEKGTTVRVLLPAFPSVG